ncbi:MAG: hypothetical protein MRY79_01800 [Alphaproteobacteria bacterium]|nr:hypothetical protein [Alphaproteobacteria bacterium]
MIKFLFISMLCVFAGLSGLTKTVGAQQDRGSEPQFFEALYDVPVMSGLEELREQQSIFDTPEGRIVQVSAVSGVKSERVFDFYGQTLPQMGWKLIKNANISSQKREQRYQREGEILQIFTEKSNSSGIVHFYLYPAP